ncbi:MAG: serine/threonine protein kinase, partial [Myxococcales bacterium]|nr:serine/threonine protein kinase [Myxococcales bacterium]
MVQPSDDSNVGRIIAERYRVDGCIGSGGLGRVYRSWDLRLKRPVALKLLRSEEDEPSDSPSATRDRRLLKEARLAGRL